VQQGQGRDGKDDQNNQLYLTTFDLTSSYFQTPLTEDSQEFTAFSTSTRRLQFLRVPMGLTVSNGAFASTLCWVFAKEIANHNLSLYVYDAILCHANFLGHLEQLRNIFHKLRTHNLRINPKRALSLRNLSYF
jgi:hypothetical protein